MLLLVGCLLAAGAPAAECAPPRSPTILAAGDSQMQGIYQLLVRRLSVRGRARVVYDAHPSTGVANPYLFSWVRHARALAASVHPDATVVFLGANDAFPLGREPCCTRGWVARYAARVRRMMHSYRRRGHGHVYWFTFPTPRSAHFRRVARGVDAAIAAAARHFPEGVSIVDLRDVLSPGGRFRVWISYHGHPVVVRTADGVHLTTAGNRIATTLLLRAMRHDDVLR